MDNNETKWAGIPFEMLSRQQKDFLIKVVNNSNRNFIVQGVAGSGKTVVAAHACEILRKRLDKDAALLVFTRLLSKFISDGFKAVRDDVISADNNTGPEVNHVHQKMREWGPDEIYDMIIVDECQDFNYSWIEEVREHSRNQMWLGDFAQQIYQKAYDQGSKEDFIREYGHGNGTNFDINFRNSRFCAEFISCFIHKNTGDTFSVEEKRKNFIEPILKNPWQNSNAVNLPSVIIKIDEYEHNEEVLVQIIKNIQSLDQPRKQIAILQFMHNDKNKISDMLDYNDIDHVKLGRSGEGKAEHIDFNDKNLVLVSTMHSIKGIEADYIIVPDTDTIKFSDKMSEEVCKNLMYVAFSRGKKRIFTTYTNEDDCLVCEAIGERRDEHYFTFTDSTTYLEK